MLSAVEQLGDYDRWERRHSYSSRRRVDSAMSSFMVVLGKHVTSVKWKYMVNELLIKVSIYDTFQSARAWTKKEPAGKDGLGRG